MRLSGFPRRFVFLLWTLLFSLRTVFAQNTFKIFFVGDAGDLQESGETLLNLRKELLSNPSSAVVFLGDNSYKNIAMHANVR